MSTDPGVPAGAVDAHVAAAVLAALDAAPDTRHGEALAVCCHEAAGYTCTRHKTLAADADGGQSDGE